MRRRSLDVRAHGEAKRLKAHDEMWKNKSSEHPWIRIFEKCQKNTFEFLLRLAVDAHNDCRAETLSARSWPSCSLSHEQSNNLVNFFNRKDGMQILKHLRNQAFIIIETQ